MKPLLPLAAALIVAFSTSSLVRAEETPAPVSDLSQFKTAADLKTYISGIDKRPVDTDAEFEKNAQTTHLATADFLKRFPKDPLAWEAKLINARLAVDATGRGITKGYDLAKAETALKEITSAPDADAKIKYAANVTLARIQLRNVPNDKLEPWLVAWHTAHPDGWQDETLGIMLADYLRNMDDAKRVAVLTTLRDSKDENIYGNGEDLLWANNRKRTAAELKAKPLDLKFTAVDGTLVDVSKMRGKVVLIDFWAVWCHSCMEQMPEVIAAYNKYNDKGLIVIGISLDEKKDLMLSKVKEKGMVWPQYYDGKNFENEISTHYGISAIPVLWLVNKKGMVVETEANGHLDEAIAKLLAEPE